MNINHNKNETVGIELQAAHGILQTKVHLVRRICQKLETPFDRDAL